MWSSALPAPLTAELACVSALRVALLTRPVALSAAPFAPFRAWLELALPFTPAAGPFGLVPLPPVFYAAIGATTATYLLLLEAVKLRFWHGIDSRQKRRHRRRVPWLSP